MDSSLHPVSFQPPRNLQTPPPCSLHFREVYWLTFQERWGGHVPAVTGVMTNHFMERATCLLGSQIVPSPYRKPAGPRTGQTFTLSHIDWSCPLPHGTDHLFSGWYKWNWLEHGLIDLLTHVSWHSGDDQAWRERRTITWSLPGPQTRGVRVSMSVPPHLWMWQRVFREKHMQHSFAFHCVCKNCSSQKRGDKWWRVAKSARSHYAALIYSVWDFDLNAGACVCAANAAGVLVWRVSASK